MCHGSVVDAPTLETLFVIVVVDAREREDAEAAAIIAGEPTWAGIVPRRCILWAFCKSNAFDEMADGR